MPKLPQISEKKLIKAFLKDDWFKVSIKGSHLKLKKHTKSAGKKIIIIPQHKTLKKGILSGILRDSGVSLEKLKKLL